MQNSTWNEFLSSCSEVWKSEGSDISNSGYDALNYLQKCEKSSKDTLIQVAASAWKLKKEAVLRLNM